MKKRLSEQDKLYIENNKDAKTYQEIAADIGTSPLVVRNYIDRKASIKLETPATEKNFRSRLINSFAWKQIKKQFDYDELDVFQERYIELMEQFKDDVEATEEKQILEMIKLEILMDRNHNERQNIRQHVKQLKDIQRALYAQYNGNYDQMEPDDRDRAVSQEQIINSYNSAEASKTQELLKLQEKHASLMRDLKGTRDQRVERIESGKTTFVDLVKQFLNEKIQQDESKANELIRESSLNEYKKLSKPIIYADEFEDRPILTAESMENE